ncbi:MAG: hypothetical protein J6A21_00035 [Lentisphaeria bacterium]|nr:hypothetical protein [Lentisphaeria bacterium]
MIAGSVFLSESGGRELFFAGESPRGNDFLSEAQALLREYDCALAESGVSMASEFLLRFHVSDIANQGALLRELLKERNTFVSIVGQPPASRARIALEAWHIVPMRKRKLAPGAFRMSWENYEAFLFRQERTVPGSYEQMKKDFESLQDFLQKENASVENNTLRTWIYCKDVDNNYAGLVKARNDFFDTANLTKETHFIASTGIAGECEDPARLVCMESLSGTGLVPGQIEHLYALENLSSTALYGVRFERGSKVVFGDRTHFYISGTASIDKEGNVLYPRDIRKQTERVMENISALMQEGGGTLSDLKLATVYLRDPADAETVTETMGKYGLSALPKVVLKAPVCRPAWLVEVECIGVNANKGEAFKPLALSGRK